jgi:hypothetical protein
MIAGDSPALVHEPTHCDTQPRASSRCWKSLRPKLGLSP